MFSRFLTKTTNKRLISTSTRKNKVSNQKFSTRFASSSIQNNNDGNQTNLTFNFNQINKFNFGNEQKLGLNKSILFGISKTKSISTTSPKNQSFKSPKEVYESLLKSNQLKADQNQVSVIERLNDLWQRLENYVPVIAKESNSETTSTTQSKHTAPKAGMFSFWNRHAAVIEEQAQIDSKQNVPENYVTGLYIWGGVGIGKTFLMDLFFDCAPTLKKKRVHFHAFMLDVQQRIQQVRQNKDDDGGLGDPLPKVAKSLAQEAWLLCFDEFQVTEVGDALIMRRLFGMLFDHGCVVVATSNRAPEDLYKDGLNRPLFLPFIDLLKIRCEVAHVRSQNDYRRERKLLSSAVFNHPLNQETSGVLRDFFDAATSEYRAKGGLVGPGSVPVMMGRTLNVPKCCDGVAQFSWSDLCAKNLGSPDYLAVAKNFHTIVLSDIPRMDHLMHNEARRFITLIDILYEQHIRVIFSAAVPEDRLFELSEEDWNIVEKGISSTKSATTKKTSSTQQQQPPADLSTKAQIQSSIHANRSAEYGAVKDITFAYSRTLSRIKEMQSEVYWQRWNSLHESKSD